MDSRLRGNDVWDFINLLVPKVIQVSKILESSVILDHERLMATIRIRVS
jgi:hypothetical protein